jgi:hypothetical protein
MCPYNSVKSEISPARFLTTAINSEGCAGNSDILTRVKAPGHEDVLREWKVTSTYS